MIGALIPGLAYFTQWTPPLLKEASLFTAALAAAVVIITYFYKPRNRRSKKLLPTSIKLAMKIFLVTFVCLILYITCFRLCTVEDPRGESRYQIGFGKFDWSLTDEGRQWKKNNPTQSTKDWLLSAAAFKDDGPELFWQPWSIILAGVLMIVLFMLTFLSWTFAWALLAKQKQLATEKEV